MRKSLLYRIYSHEIIIGLLLFIISILMVLSFVKNFTILSIIFMVAVWLAIGLITDGLMHKIHKVAYFPINKHRIFFLGKIFIISFFFCSIIDFIGVFYLRLWYYPYLNIFSYLLIAPIAFAVYTFILFSFYENLKKKFDFMAKRGPLTKKQIYIYPFIINIQFFFGLVLLILSFLPAQQLFEANGLSNHLMQISTTLVTKGNWWISITVPLGVYSIFEYLTFKQGKETLTKDFLRRDYVPILAISIANIFAIILIEFTNGPFQLWIFDNWFMNEVRILNVPIMALLVWPLQFPVFLSMFRYFFAQKEIDIW